MQPTRQSILAYLEENHAASARQMGRALQLSAADVRYHLGALRRAGLVEAYRLQSAQGRGRPAHLYRLTLHARPDNYLMLSRALLTAIRHAPSDCLQQAAQAIAGDPPAEGMSLTRRLVAAVRRLNELHYRARWEARPAAPQVRFDACPYAAILDDYPELCRLDALLLEHLTGRSVRQIARLAPAEESVAHDVSPEAGACMCIFIILNA